MENKLKKQLELLKNSVLSEDFVDIAYEITEEIEGYEEAIDAVDPILLLIEQNPNIDFGSPGPLVHFVEQFFGKGYEQKLVQSIQRCPTSHTVWMLNRIINGVEGEGKIYYIDILQNVLKHPNVSNDLSSFTKDLLSLHV
ncbi:hypothetical protein [Gottfriedia sp. OAE603]